MTKNPTLGKDVHLEHWKHRIQTHSCHSIFPMLQHSFQILGFEVTTINKYEKI